MVRCAAGELRKECLDAPTMKAKRKPIAPKKNWQAIRRRYTWHLRSPFKEEFDRSHWWKGKDQSKIEPVAALYELARRHPHVIEVPPKKGWQYGITSDKWQALYEPRPSLHSTQRFGMKSWPTLTTSEQEEWKSSVGMMKGLDFRKKDDLCISVTKSAHLTITQQRHVRHQEVLQTAPENLKGLYDVIGSIGLFVNPNPTDREMEAAVAQQAIEAYHRGYLLLAVAPDLSSDKATVLMQKIYGDTKRKYANPKQRARSENWLPLISEFEDVPDSPKSDAFNRYRRVLDGIHFA
jgi:hypothetical protein